MAEAYREPKYPRLVVKGKMHVRLQKAADKRNKPMSEITEKVLSAGFRALHW